MDGFVCVVEGFLEEAKDFGGTNASSGPTSSASAASTSDSVFEWKIEDTPMDRKCGFDASCECASADSIVF